MATYNGEGFLGKQIDSILQQTVVPDEIIISDDGSRDHTVEIARQYAERYRDLTEIVVLTDNPRHGIGGNFSWAIGHATGDCIFICGQDDVWSPDKVARILDIYRVHPDAELVCHDLFLIDNTDRELPVLSEEPILKLVHAEPGESCKVPRDVCVTQALSTTLVSGNAVCISRSLQQKILPIPVDCAEDKWLVFCAAADDQLYFLNERLTGYRIHNSTTHSVSLGWYSHFKKSLKRIGNAFGTVNDYLNLGNAAERYVNNNASQNSYDFSDVTRIAERLRSLADTLLKAAGSGRLSGARMLRQLYRNDRRYRGVGRKSFLLQLAHILLYSKKARRRMLHLNDQESVKQ